MKQLHYIIVLVTLLFVMSCDDLLTDIDIDGDDTVDSKNKAVAIIGSHMVNDKAVEIIKDDLLIEGNSVRDALLTKDAQGEWKAIITEDGITFIFIPSKDIPADSTGFPQKDLVAGTEYPIVITHTETENGISISDSDILGDIFINDSGNGTGGSGSGTGGSGSGAAVVPIPHSRAELRALIRERIKRDGRNADLNDIDVRNVPDMNYLFLYLDFDGDISKWDVSNVTTMYGMFYLVPFTGDISNWDITSVKDLGLMFVSSPFNGDITGWDTSNVDNMAGMFQASGFNQDISGWDVSNVEQMGYMFRESIFNQDISGWDVSNVEGMVNMFVDAKKMTYNLEAWGSKLNKNLQMDGVWSGSSIELAGNKPSWAPK